MTIGARIILGPTSAALAPVPASSKFELRSRSRRKHQPGEYEFSWILPVRRQSDIVISFQTFEEAPRPLIGVQAAGQCETAQNQPQRVGQLNQAHNFTPASDP